MLISDYKSRACVGLSRVCVKVGKVSRGLLQLVTAKIGRYDVA